jgi:putative peptide zinc metalloprotease protein
MSGGTPQALDRAPSLAPTVELVGALEDSGFRDRQWLIREGDRFLEVSELLYRIAEQLDGRRALEEIAKAVTDRVPWRVTAEQVGQLIATKLAPMGVVEDDSAPAHARAPTSPLQLAGKSKVLGPATIDPVTRILRVLFWPPVLVAVTLAIAAAHAWLYLGDRLAVGLVELLYHPALVLPLLVIIIIAGFFHEFGHAAALRYGGGRARAMGFGFYLIYPALYTDTSDAYRLRRWDRVRVDLGGFYFHLVFAVGLMGLALATGHEFVLVAVLVINLELLRQLLFPFVRFDGYWLLADLTGLPDLYSHARPFLGSLLPRSRWSGPRLPALKAWVHRVFVVYLILVAIVLPTVLYVFVTRAPRFVAVARDSVDAQAWALSRAVDVGDPFAFFAAAVQIIILVLPLVGAIVMLAVLARSVAHLARALALMRSTPFGEPSALQERPRADGDVPSRVGLEHLRP